MALPEATICWPGGPGLRCRRRSGPDPVGRRVPADARTQKIIDGMAVVMDGGALVVSSVAGSSSTRAAPGAADSAATTFTARFARVVTEALTPAVLVAGIAVAVAWHSRSIGWGIVAVLFASGIPITYIIRGVRRGHYHDHHVSVRERRPTVILFAAASVGVGLAPMILFRAPRELVALVVAMLAGLVLTLAVTKWWGKVSFHSAVASGTATTLLLVFGPWLHLTWLVVGLVVWARVRLEEHTVAQTLTGAGLGALAAGVVFPLVR